MTSERYSPNRLSLPDFSGRSATLSDSPGNWRIMRRGEGPTLLLLGLGPGNPWEHPRLREAQARGAKIFWMEAPATLAAIKAAHGAAWLYNFPPEWEQLENPQMERLPPGTEILFYQPGLRLEPDFWAKIIASMDAASWQELPAKQLTAWLPGNDRLLLHQELKLTLSQAGFSQIMEDAPAEFPKDSQLWKGHKPDFALSINFRGLDPEGRIFNLCHQLEIPLAIWLVDNPWHLLSAIRLPWWRKANLFVTDSSFIPTLMENGARHVHFCPLAVAPHMWRPRQQASTECKSPVFVGRSSFPGRDSFFGAAKLDQQVLAQASTLMDSERGALPDYHWWQQKLGIAPWPRKEGRIPGLGAELCSQANRASWLAACAPITIIGDAGWKKFLPHAHVLPPVDYYNGLSEVYNHAKCVLNVTSLLLPHSLNQRHFDVWAAGGLLLTDDTKGLDIFPSELVEPIVVKSPRDFHERVAAISTNPAFIEELSAKWRELLHNEHQYSHRLNLIRKKLETNA